MKLLEVELFNYFLDFYCVFYEKYLRNNSVDPKENFGELYIDKYWLVLLVQIVFIYLFIYLFIYPRKNVLIYNCIYIDITNTYNTYNIYKIKIHIV